MKTTFEEKYFVNSIVVFRVNDSDELDWRCGGQALPAGSVPLEVTVARGDEAKTLALHGHAHDSEIAVRIREVRNEAIGELVEGGKW